MFGVEGHHAILRNARLSGALLKDVEFVDADFTGAEAIKVKLFRGVFTGARMDSADFSLCDFTGADLKRVTARTTRFIGTSFSGAQLEFADFSGANLNNADFQGATFENTIFRNAINIPKQIKKFINEEGVANGTVPKIGQ